MPDLFGYQIQSSTSLYKKSKLDDSPTLRRSLQVMSDSRTCKRDCIDAGKIFCPTATHTSGTCCAATSTTCPRAAGDVCSNDIKNAQNALIKYWTCGQLCSNHPSYKITQGFGSIAVTTLDTAIKSIALEESCSWLLQFTTGASTNDTLTFRVNRIRYGTVIYMVTNSYTDTGSNFTIASTTTDGFRLTIYFP